MASKDESILTRLVCDKLKREHGGSAFVIAGGNAPVDASMRHMVRQVQQPGLPDRVLAWWGYMGFIEFKTCNGKLELNQKLIARELNARFPLSVAIVRFAPQPNPLTDATAILAGYVEDAEGTALGAWAGLGGPTGLLSVLAACRASAGARMGMA